MQCVDEVLLFVPGHVYDRTDDIYYMMPESVCIHYIVTLSTRPDSHRVICYLYTLTSSSTPEGTGLSTSPRIVKDVASQCLPSCALCSQRARIPLP